MTSFEIRQSFLEFFREKQHTLVPSSPLMPDSPNLLFTNAGMNQFVPIFLGQLKCPYVPGRAADTQKCIRAGGKHNDLDDVGLDTYHHTFFEMLGNWSFGDYFKKEAIEWAWELIVERWKFPAERLYATVYKPGSGDPSEFDQEAYDLWAKFFITAGLDPKVHIVNGNKKDNFWMMGDTGPCGPCSELHVDLTPNGDTKGALVNMGDARCIEIWNLVFIQFNANSDGTFSPLPAQHVDTGMGFERVTSIIQGTKNFSDFATAKISNYETDIFRPIFDELENLTGRKYTSTLPDGSIENPYGDGGSPSPHKLQIETDIAFRVIADHIRTLSFAIADGILPGNNDRNYVLRRILRRAVLFGRKLGFSEPFFYKLSRILADQLGDVFPEIRSRHSAIETALRTEEEAFNKTIDRGIKMFEQEVFARTLAAAAQREGLAMVQSSESFWVPDGKNPPEEVDVFEIRFLKGEEVIGDFLSDELLNGAWHKILKNKPRLSGDDAFKLYDTYGFPLDLTELMAHERGLEVDKDGFEALMEQQRDRARAAQKKEVITAESETHDLETRFIGFDTLQTDAQLLDVVARGEDTFAVVDVSPFYAEMGGQVGDTGTLELGGLIIPVTNTLKRGHTFYLKIPSALSTPSAVKLSVDTPRRRAIERHHTVTHLLHWALHEVVSRDASQKGSHVAPDKLTFDFNSAALTVAQIRDVEKLVNERILENVPVSWIEVPHADVKSRKDIQQFFGDKYGDEVRVVQIGGSPDHLNGYSMELCGGTHVRATGEIGLFRILGEAAIAAGVRRIEAVAGTEASTHAVGDAERLIGIASKLNSPIAEIEKKLDALLGQHKELEKALKAASLREAANRAGQLVSQAETVNGVPTIIANLGHADGDTLQAIADTLKTQFPGVILLGGSSNDAVSLVAAVSPDFTSKIQAGKLIQQIAPIVGGKGGGRPDNARGGGKDASKLDEALAHAKTLF